MFVLWYCHKRGREERLLKEAADTAAEALGGSPRVEELPDHRPALPHAPSSSSRVPDIRVESGDSRDGPKPSAPRSSPGSAASGRKGSAAWK